MKTYRLTAVSGFLTLWLASCADTVATPSMADDQVLAEQIAAALIAACPMATTGDEAARGQCAANLSDNKSLASVMNEPFLWGGQKAGTSYHLEESPMNRFNIYVWRRLYLSLMMFNGESRIEQTPDGMTVLHLGTRFRNELEMGSYPYPFWHSKKKWDSYEQSEELLLIVQKGKWVGAMRSAVLDPTRPHVAHTWSGQWTWTEGTEEMPYVTLYKYLLSPKNPHTTRLDAAYRSLSEGLRGQACFMCHSPDNHAAMPQLEFFNYPNQALYSRSSIVDDLVANVMPPANNDLGLPAGIPDEAERQELLVKAREFKKAGDDALAFEGELKPYVPFTAVPID